MRFSEGLHVSADAASRLYIYVGITTFIGRLLSGILCNIRAVNPIYVFMLGLALLSNNRLMGLCHWMVSHCHGWIGSDGVAFFINLLE